MSLVTIAKYQKLALSQKSLDLRVHTAIAIMYCDELEESDVSWIADMY